jgi:hypothetical protein
MGQRTISRPTISLAREESRPWLSTRRRSKAPKTTLTTLEGRAEGMTMEKVAGGPERRVSAKQAEVAGFRILETILELLSKPTAPAAKAPSVAAPKPFTPCDRPSTTTAPAYVIPMRRTVLFLEIDLAVDPASQLAVACVGASLPPNRVSGAPWHLPRQCSGIVSERHYLEGAR